MTTKESLKSEWPDLEIGGGCVVAAKNLRKILKKTWPKVKFSVTTSRFAGGNSMSVRWLDGPTTKMVEAWANRFSAGNFDGMTDYYNYESSPWTELFGSAKYVSCNRKYSDAAIASAITKTVAEYGPGENVTVEAWRNGDLNRVTPVIGARAYGPDSWAELIYVALYNEAM